ncbi:alpha-amylase family glycosyl hydrolase [Pontibacter liquoris]|uniref:DUF4961 domain-containing protein n=1 Tax=Pontibacter liquoris TaxID=2905677 RepID=UPI001FA77380|nr:alpha-amylase family glycosyl hydrolase [Pontibacter liquoris]
MQKLYTLFLFLLIALPSYVSAQVVATDPAFVTADKEVTLIFDVSQAKDARAKGLLGKTDDVYLWSGAGTTATGDAFTYQPAGQTNFNAPFTPGKMTSLGNNRWQIKLVPRTYFGVPAGTPIRRLGLLLKSGDGKAQTEDLFVSVYEDKLSVSFKKPAETSFFVDANSAIAIEAVASAKATLTLKNGTTVLQTLPDADALTYTLNTGTAAGVKQVITLEAKTATETATTSFAYTVKPQPAVADLPAGVKDGINYINPSTVILSLFAPEKSFVYAIGEFNNWTPSAPYLMNRTPDGKHYWLQVDGLLAGQETAFQYLVDGTLSVADPYAQKILDPNNDQYITATSYPNLKPYPTGASGIVSILQTNQTTYTWKVTDFKRPDVSKMVVYELLVRDFVATQNYTTLADTLSYLKRLGVNAIELMPVTEFTGNDSWGYNPTFYFAPDKAYGTANNLKAFIDKCHEYGMAVILDMVLNQADYEFPYVKMYWDGNKPAANNPYFNQQATHPYSVFFDFNHESPATQAFVDRVAAFWLQEYNIDGYRFDLSKGFTQKNSGNDVGAWSAYDASRVATWKRIYDNIRQVDPTAYVILEHFADNTEEKELANYGMLFWGNHNYDYRSMAKGNNANPEWISYKKREWQHPNVVGYMESHDEERIVYDVLQNGRSGNTYTTRVLAAALNRDKLAAAFFLPVPGPKLIWQFGELGYDVSIDQGGRTARKPLRWEYQKNTERQKLYDVYAALINLKVTQPVFQTTDFTLALDGIVKRITLNDADITVFLIGNFDVHNQSVPANFPAAGTWYDYFTGQQLSVTSPAETIMLQPGEFRLYSTKALPAPKPNLVPWQNVVLAAKDELMNSDNLLIYPNPANGATMVELSDPYRGEVTLQLSNMTGAVLRTVKTRKSQQTFSQPLNLQGIAAGTYFLQIQTGTKRMVKKVVKLP